MSPSQDSTPHPVATQPPSPSRGEGDPVHADALERFSDPETDSAPPSPLEGEGARRAGEGSLPKRARQEWRTASTKRLRGFARSMRSSPTEVEQRLWGLVRNRRFIDYKFRRQVPIGRYIVDLMCPSAMLIVELDGSQHAANPRDAVRDAWLAQQGYRVLRIWNNDLTHNRDGVLDAIWYALEESRP